MDNFAETVRDHQNKIQAVSGTVASAGFTAIGKNAAGVVVTPATWALNYAVDGRTPNAADLGIFSAGFISAPASAVVGLLKATVDDSINQKLKQAKQDEDPIHQPYIRACYHYSYAPELINAQKIASAGGTAWLHKNGLWVYIVASPPKKGDEELMVVDFKPKAAVKVYQPKQPLRRNHHGQLIWGSN